jgi:predicted component of type VI protein secretion system
MHRLIFTDPAFAGQSCALRQGVASLGRSRGNACIILDESVSGRHCELLVHWTEVIVRDSGSRNGTFVDGVRVEGQAGVSSGQRLRFGRVAAVLRLERPVGPEGTEITACHCYGQDLERLAVSSSPPAPVIVTPCRVFVPPNSTEKPHGTLLADGSLPVSSDPARMPVKGTARYWRRIVRTLAS